MNALLPAIESVGFWTFACAPGSAPIPRVRATTLRQVEVASMCGGPFDWVRHLPRGVRLELMPGGDSELQGDHASAHMLALEPFVKGLPTEHRAFYETLRRKLRWRRLHWPRFGWRRLR